MVATVTALGQDLIHIAHHHESPRQPRLSSRRRTLFHCCLVHVFGIHLQGASGISWPILRVLFDAAVVIGVGWWARSKATDKNSNSCKMTFSRPEYVHLPVAGYSSGVGAGEPLGEAPGYGYRLMRYVDRKLPAGERADPLKPGGTPVLFVPGHLGSYKQVPA